MAWFVRMRGYALRYKKLINYPKQQSNHAVASAVRFANCASDLSLFLLSHFLHYTLKLFFTSACTHPQPSLTLVGLHLRHTTRPFFTSACTHPRPSFTLLQSSHQHLLSHFSIFIFVITRDLSLLQPAHPHGRLQHSQRGTSRLAAAPPRSGRRCATILLGCLPDMRPKDT
jgi:hypothetical protein